jgi:hypothetical protein
MQSPATGWAFLFLRSFRDQRREDASGRRDSGARTPVLDNVAPKLVLEQRSVPNWKKLLERLLSDKEILAGVRLKFKPICEDMNRDRDFSEALAAILGQPPAAKKTN